MTLKSAGLPHPEQLAAHESMVPTGTKPIPGACPYHVAALEPTVSNHVAGRLQVALPPYLPQGLTLKARLELTPH